MIVKIITKDDFNGHDVQKGSLEGTFADAQEYLGWVLSSIGTDNGKHFDEAVKVFQQRFKMPYFTTKYLRGLISSDVNNKNQKIKHLVKSAGYGLVGTKRYFRELRCVVREIKNLIYTNKDGTIDFSERKDRVSRLANVFVGEQLHKIVPNAEINETRRRLNAEILKSELLAETTCRDNFAFFTNFEDKSINTTGINVGWDKDFKCLDIKRVMFLKDDRKESQKIESDYQVEKAQQRRQDKAINKLSQKGQLWNILNCSRCKHQIKLPVYSDIKDEKIFDIMNAVAKDIKDGITFCKDCKKLISLEVEGDKWNNDKIKTFLLEVLNNNSINEGVCFTADEFGQEYRIDGQPQKSGYVREIIKDLLLANTLDDQLKVIASKELIKIQVIKKN